MTLDESIAFSHRLVARGCDFIDASSGGVSPAQKIPLGPGYQVRFAREIRQATGSCTMAVGLISTPAQAEAIVAAGDADLVAMARALLWDPRWVWHAAAALRSTVVPPPQYLRGAPREAANVFGGARIAQRIDGVPHAVDQAVPGSGFSPEYPPEVREQLLVVVPVFDVLFYVGEHLHDLFVRAAVLRPLEGADGRRDGRIDVGSRRGEDAAGEG
jgi:hypothetical protein